MQKVLLVGSQILVLLVCVWCKSIEEGKKCKIPPTAPARIQHVISDCQDEIKFAIISEALQLLQENEHPTKSRVKRASFSNDERRIAGCLLQCVYRKMNAINENGFPTVEGLMAIYTEGVEDKEYNIATAQAVYSCLQGAQQKHIVTPQSLEEDGKTCDIAYHVFDCVSDQIGKYCGGQTP